MPAAAVAATRSSIAPGGDDDVVPHTAFVIRTLLKAFANVVVLDVNTKSISDVDCGVVRLCQSLLRLGYGCIPSFRRVCCHIDGKSAAAAAAALQSDISHRSVSVYIIHRQLLTRAAIKRNSQIACLQCTQSV